MIRSAAALLLAAALAAAAPASAQRGGRPAPPPPAQKAPEPPPPPPPEPPAPPYEKELLRLSEIVGSLAFLRTLCAGPDAPEWPKRMQALIDTEGTTPARRERLAGAYNRGYGGWALTYRVCTPSAQEATARFLQEGETLSRNLTSRSAAECGFWATPRTRVNRLERPCWRRGRDAGRFARSGGAVPPAGAP
jgi:uncharacterized protein (TIGR02301 family)